MNEPQVFLNGEFLPQSAAGLALHDAGFVFGATITDFCRTFGHRLFRLEDHLERFRHDCQACHVPLRFDLPTLVRTAQALVARNASLIDAESDLALITFATPGPIGYYLGQSGRPGEHPTCGMHTFPLPLKRYQHLFRDGATLLVAGSQPAGDLIDPRVKHRSRMLWWLADQRIQQRPDYVAGALPLLLDEPDGHILETSFANVLVVFDGVVTSPPATSILDGIGLRIAREICRDRGIPWIERPIRYREMLNAADEIMLTGTAFGIAGVRRIESREWPCPGVLTLELVREFSDRAKWDIARQILASR